MRFSIFAAIAAFGPTVLAQSLLSQIPQCAQTCFGNSLGNCGPADLACICGNSSVIDKVSCCVFATCSPSDIQATTQFAVQLCKLQNINVNTAPVCASGSSTVAGSSTTSGSAAASASGSATSSGSIRPSASVSGGSVVAGSRTSSASAAANTGAAPMQTAGAHLGLGMAMAGLIAAL
ncbi:hypothetical protein IQ06DRAFT_891 [Phaeosphaeriaceae sp. SRC1lsM3a]|nr:hypothetical protein IQ06DRAFT_891 [Stagonospora sp. SRC1lsM3a]